MFVVLYSKYSEKCNQLLPHLDQNFLKICVDNKNTRKFVSKYISGVPCLFVKDDQQMYRYDGINDIINFIRTLEQQNQQQYQIPPQNSGVSSLDAPGGNPDVLQQEISSMGASRGASTLSLAQQMAAEREQEEKERSTTPI